MLVKVLWRLYFIQAQGYKVYQHIIYQDNMATMRLEINDTLSSSKHTKHTKARYFFIKDKVDSGEVEIEHCPTDTMWADVLNKPKGGKPFRLDHSYLMNVAVDYDNDLELLQTHPDLLPKADQNLDNSQRKSVSVNHRSVLGDHAITGSRLNDSQLGNFRLTRITHQSDITCQSDNTARIDQSDNTCQSDNTRQSDDTARIARQLENTRQSANQRS